MPALTPQFLIDVETRMRIVSDREYLRLLSNLWWTAVAKESPSTGKRERLIWLLESAKIQYVDRLAGTVEFEDVLSNTIEYENKAATAGFKINRTQLEDHDGGGVDLAGQWAGQMGAYAAYWPQKQVADAIRKGTAATSLAYDSLPFFSGSHLVNPFDSSAGTYANLHKTSGGATGAGACPIDSSVTVDVAFNNLQKVFTNIRSIPMPNGEDPRFLRPAGLLVPPALSMRAKQITNAKYIAQAAASGGGGADVEAVVRDWGIGQPYVCDELGSAFGGSDTDYYVVLEQVGNAQVGALTYFNREAFQIIYNGLLTDAQLARMNELQWLTRGRNVVGYGHPYLLHKVSAT